MQHGLRSVIHSRMCIDYYIRYFLCKSNTEEVFTIDFNILLRDFCLFILGIYGTKIFDYLHTLVQKREVQHFIFLTVSFFAVHMLLTYL